MSHGAGAPSSRGRETATYTPASQLRRPGALLRGMVHDLAAGRELAWRLFLRDTSARYRQTLLGYVWAFLPPLVSTIIFLYLRRAGVVATPDAEVAYPVFLLTGLVLWQTLVDAVQAPIRMVNQSRSLLARVHFPREALVLAGIGEVLFNFLVRCLLVAATFLYFRVAVSPSLALVPLGVLALIGVGTAIGLVLVPFSVLYQDVERGLALFVMLWMFVTPVLYPVPAAGAARLTLTANPASAILDTTRAWLLGAPPAYLGAALAVALATLLVLLAGWVLYRLALPILIERMSA